MEQDRIHIKLARRTPEERQADETRRLDPFMRALKAIHTAATPETMNVEDLEKQRKGQELLGRLVAPMAGMSWEPFELDGMNCAWVRPHRGHDRRRAILYCHGGGYTSGNLGYSRILASKLANVTGWQVLSFEYRLAPEHPYPAAVEDAVKAWDYLMYQGYGARDVVVAGDSAGGNLALVLTHLLKEAGRRLPPEALEDEQFAAMLEEAEKYLGYPYVWGGSSPSTSFDCSGFVSWVINHSGWDVGRLGAQSLCNICTPVTAANAKPGDLVF